MIVITEESKVILKKIMMELNQTPKDEETGSFLKKLRESLRARLLYLHTYACRNEGDKLDLKATRCTLCPDFAPFSFGFGMEKRGSQWHTNLNSSAEEQNKTYTRWFVGGLIFNAGAGFPTFTCSLSDSIGWSVHT